MLAGVNDNPEQAHELGRLLGPRSQQYLVNLIPWNPVFSPGIDFEAPGPDRLTAFHDIVRSHGLQCTVRREMGQEIAGRLLGPACSLVDTLSELMMWTSGSVRSGGLGQAWLEGSSQMSVLAIVVSAATSGPSLSPLFILLRLNMTCA